MNSTQPTLNAADIKLLKSIFLVKSDAAKFATKDDLKAALKPYSTKDDLKAALKPYTTKKDLERVVGDAFDDLARIINSTVVTKIENHELRITSLEIQTTNPN